ncbi:MAG TPA: hypothetical protein VMS93_13300, partial [Candidatus Saccharimonadales bacterium]|nr:hypothetical protein [Candidatus Saccharimonadales bacterium]
MFSWIGRYARWLHTGWPAGRVEKLPRVGEGGRTNVPGVYVCGDLAGLPLLKFALDSGARAARAIAADLGAGRGVPGAPEAAAPAPRAAELPDLLILGGGVSGMA